MDVIVAYVEQLTNSHFEEKNKTRFAHEEHLMREIAYMNYPPSFPADFIPQRGEYQDFWSKMVAILEKRNPMWSFGWSMEDYDVWGNKKPCKFLVVSKKL